MRAPGVARGIRKTPRSEIKVHKTDIYNTLKTVPKGKSNYFIIASSLKIEQLDFTAMRKYMEAGNHIFIAAFQMEGALADSLKTGMTTASSSGWVPTVMVHRPPSRRLKRGQSSGSARPVPPENAQTALAVTMRSRG
ncbi:MAG: hypothetical protein EOO38_32395 [Cytophagaceae bacterium]|nr:MAG: hypothetical protein EOO38_32395 [Cytophagaceae bacterium]